MARDEIVQMNLYDQNTGPSMPSKTDEAQKKHYGREFHIQKTVKLLCVTLLPQS